MEEDVDIKKKIIRAFKNEIRNIIITFLHFTHIWPVLLAILCTSLCFAFLLKNLETELWPFPTQIIFLSLQAACFILESLSFLLLHNWTLQKVKTDLSQLSPYYFWCGKLVKIFHGGWSIEFDWGLGLIWRLKNLRRSWEDPEWLWKQKSYHVEWKWRCSDSAQERKTTGVMFWLFWDDINVLEKIALWLTPFQSCKGASWFWSLHVLVIMIYSFSFVSLKAWKIRMSTTAEVEVQYKDIFNIKMLTMTFPHS